MKKLLSFILAVAMSVSCVGMLSGCSGSSLESKEDTAEAEASVSVAVEEEEDASVSVVEEEEDSSASSDDGYEELTWPVNEMASVLPEPPSTRGEVEIEADDNTYIRLVGFSEENFGEYSDELYLAGFSASVDRGSTYYEGFTENGYYIWASYSSSSAEMTIDLTIYDYDLNNVSDEIVELMQQFIDVAETYVELEEKVDSADEDDYEALTSEVEDLQTAYEDFSNEVSALNEDDLTVDELRYIEYIADRCNALVE